MNQKLQKTVHPTQPHADRVRLQPLVLRMFDKSPDGFSADAFQPVFPADLQVQQKADEGDRVRPQRVGSAVAPVEFTQICLNLLKPAKTPLDDLLQRPVDNLLLASAFVAFF